MTVSVNIVSWNSRAVLEFLISSLKQQTRPADRILVIDNGSNDDTLSLLERTTEVHVLRNHRNIGFAPAHNQGLRITNTDFVLITNPDIIVAPNCLELLVNHLTSQPNTASVSPKVLRYSLTGGDLSEAIRSDTIDAAGMAIKKSRQVINRGEGEHDIGQYDRPQEVFAAPGMLALYRKSALVDVADNHEYFDNDFFAYKEDADLGWRLRWAGWRSDYLPQAVAWHRRTITHHGDRFSQVGHIRGQRSSWLRQLSYRNHLFMLLKNERLGTLLPHFLNVAWYELKKIIYLLVREPATLRGIFSSLHRLPRIVRKRRTMNARRRISDAKMRSFFT